MDAERAETNKTEQTYGGLRYLIAAILIFYGSAKLNHAQFTVLDSQLDLPLKEVSGFWLTWYYFGYSAVYGAVIAMAQIVPAVLLLFRKTSLLGALLLAPVLLNIVLIDLCFAIDPGAMVVAVLLLAGDLVLLWSRREVLRAALLPLEQADREDRTVRAVGPWIARASVVVLPFLATYWIAHYNNRNPTPIDGAWRVVRSNADGTDFAPVSNIYFEYNRAGMCVLRDANGRLETHGFHVRPGQQRVSIEETWMRDDAVLFDGMYRRDGDTLLLTGVAPGPTKPVSLELRRERMPVKDHDLP